MTDDRTLDRAARSWLEQGPTQAPDRAVDAALSRIQTIGQERELRLPWRFPPMTSLNRFAGAALLVLAVVGAAVLLMRPAVNVGPGASPSPSSGPSAGPSLAPTPTLTPTLSPTPRPTLTTLVYSKSNTSSIFKYSVKYPSTWTLQAGTAPNFRDTITDIGSGFNDYYGDGVSSGVMVTSGPLSATRPDLASFSQFITGTIKGQYGNYIELAQCQESTRTLTVAGEPAIEEDFICPNHDWLWVTVVHGGLAYQIAWLDDGGFTAAYLRPFLDQFLGGFKFTT